MATKSDAVALPGARAVARHVRVSPMKARRVVDLVLLRALGLVGHQRTLPEPA